MTIGAERLLERATALVRARDFAGAETLLEREVARVRPASRAGAG